MFRRRDAPAARETGKIGLRPPARRAGARKRAALGFRLEPGEPAAGEHRIDAMRRGAVSGDLHVPSGRADFPHRNRRDPQIEVGIRRARNRPLRRARRLQRARRRPETAKLAPSPPKTKGNGRRSKRVGDGRDHACADHVHRLVASLRDRLGRADHVGEADDPVVRQRTIVLRASRPRRNRRKSGWSRRNCLPSRPGPSARERAHH